jgi:ferric-dicitrate binding protein FerR (iron transport regulator)
MMNEDIRINPKWSKSKESIWMEHFEKLTSKEETHIDNTIHFGKYIRYIAAAAVVLVFLIPGIYTRSVVAKRGEQVSLVLPDGSLVSLNADSKVTYKPLIWRIMRSVKMEGEAYFEVEKGSKFVVSTKNGVVRVLGTKFNVLSRGETFSVSCISGRVEVKSDKTVVLDKETRAKLGNDGKLYIEYVNEIGTVILWRNYIFNYTETPLKEVIDEISRQYNITIEYS